ncbi:MAG: hypothetical protein IKG93_00265 [Clostridiales bacterium]|nr:hypothetical protein [Clostridiales bacterium]
MARRSPDNTNPKALRAVSFSIIAAMLMCSSCGQKKESQETSDAASTGTSAFSEETTTSNETTEASSQTSTKESTTPSWAPAGSMPGNFDFNLSFSEDLKIFDYDRTTVNVYKAKYDERQTSWEDGGWIANAALYVNDWCTGVVIQNPEDYFKQTVLEREKVIMNLHNVEIVSLDQLQDYEDVAKRLNIPTDTKVPCWTYSVEGFPWEFFNSDNWFAAIPAELPSTKYVHLSTQYVDGLPLYGGSSLQGFKTYEWEDVIKPSRIQCTPGYDPSEYTKADWACTFCFNNSRFVIGEKIQSDLSIVDPRSCLDEIKRAIKYSPVRSNSRYGEEEIGDILDFWETDVEVYMMELTYVVLDPAPLHNDDPMLKMHDLTLVPVWEVYMTVKDPDNVKVVAHETVMINAVTGRSMFSDNYGLNENAYLFPEANTI